MEDFRSQRREGVQEPKPPRKAVDSKLVERAGPRRREGEVGAQSPKQVC